MKRQLKSTAATPARTPRKPRPSTAGTKTSAASGNKAAAATSARKSKPTAATPALPTNATAASSATPDLYSSIHALLHTMRIIEQHEEALCSMHDELKRTGRLAAPRRRDLQRLLAELPTDHYQTDLQAVQQALSA